MKCYAVFSPRILLSFQLLKEFSKYLRSKGVDADYLNVNSGRFDDQEINEARMAAGFISTEIKSTTSPDEIKAAYELAKARNKPLIISSTYHSAKQIVESGISVDVQLNDEAHHLVSEDFGKFTDVGKAVFSFTATPRTTTSDIGFGMNNKTKFGEPIFRRTPLQMIEAGEMVPPALHIIRSDERLKKDAYDGIFEAVVAAFEKHAERLQEKSAGRIAPKMLVTLDGQKTLRGILTGKKLAWFREHHPSIHVLAMSSGMDSWTGSVYIDGTTMKCSNRAKNLVFKELQTMPDDQAAIILYVDMLTEGIDVPGITAFMPIRSLSDTAFRQGVGRACRLNKTDRAGLYGGTLTTKRRDKFIKPYAYIVVPEVMLNSEDYADRFKDQLWALCEDYGMEPDTAIFDQMNGISEESALEAINPLRRKPPMSKDAIEKYVHDIREKMDRQIDVDEIAFVTLINRLRDSVTCDEGDVIFKRQLSETALETVATVFKKLGYKDALEEYLERSWRRREYDYVNDKDGMIDKMRKKKKNKGVFDEDVKRRFGTVYTPEFVVKKTVDLAWKYLPKDVSPLDLTWCDPAGGDGNFLVHLYDRLMGVADARFTDPIEKSRHILTKCLSGIEILGRMVKACKLRLLDRHLTTVSKIRKPVQADVLFDELNVWHGNTIMMPGDVGKWALDEANQEGELLDEEKRNKKYDVIVGNPPYTHLRNIQWIVNGATVNNRRYSKYPNQRDMAQVFVRWSLDHLTEQGICSLNTSNAMLKIKLIDGCKETRGILSGKIREVINNSDVEYYSVDDGGYIGTFIICFNHFSKMSFILNGKEYPYSTSDLMESAFLYNVSCGRPEFKSVSGIFSDFPRFHTGKRFDQDNRQFIDNIYIEHGNTESFLIFKQSICIAAGPSASFKILRSDEISSSLKQFESEIKYKKINYNFGLFLMGFLNSSHGTSEVMNRAKFVKLNSNGSKVYTISTPHLQGFAVPDYDFYLLDRPERVKAYLVWIETNMRDKEAFLKGIDQEFERMIK
ncbi:MAG: hypothetical protein Q8K86_10695 [Candidatus Nanopelagicaceae bacterium]|nr:hypothetical protein [Candidatus Nanopelagicaceae bacterium]